MERDNSRGGAAIHELASPLYKGSKDRDNSWGGAAIRELASPLYKGSKDRETAGAVQQYMN